MRFSRVELTNWKNFRHVEIELPDRVFLVGPNASGKSNFLDVFRFLRDVARPGGGLRNACDERGGVSKIRCLVSRQPSGVVIAVELNDEGAIKWRYELAFTQDTKFPMPRTPKIIKEVVFKNGEPILERPGKDDTKDPLRLTQTALEQVYFNQHFREIQEYFAKVSYLHLIPQIVRSGMLSSDSNVPDFYGGQFLEKVAETQGKLRRSRLKRISDALKIAVPQLENLDLERDNRGVPHLKVLYKHWRPRAGQQDETQLSDGTLRLLALLWSLEDGDGPLLMEEPEISLHNGIVRRLPGIIHRLNRKNRQVIISTHSAELLSDAGVSGHETLVLVPTDDGTQIHLATEFPDVRGLLEAGVSVAEAVIPRTEPKEFYQLDFLDRI